MPFQSKAQSKACFATGGFGGKVDCKEFADKTDYKDLPEKVMKKIGTEGSRKKNYVTKPKTQR
jgi:hypothetical protein